MKSPAPIFHALLIGSLFSLTAPAHAAPPTEPAGIQPSTNLPRKTAALVGSRSTLLVALPDGPAWQDMAFLAAIPAMTVINLGAPSLVALEAAGALTPEVKDYLRRYRPDKVAVLGPAADNLEIAGRTCAVLKAGSAEEAACALSTWCWQTAATAVICQAGDYEAALVAAPLAARLRMPLFFTGETGLSPAATAELRRLKTQDLIVVGNPAGSLPSLQQVSTKVTALTTAHDVVAWTRKRGLKVTYLAALNPLDREQTVIKKLSLAGALLAAGRDGLVVPLTYKVRWKLPFNGVAMQGKLPLELPSAAVPPLAGRISIGARQHTFILTGEPMPRQQQLFIDRDDDGKFNGTGEGPFATGATVELDGQRLAITLGTDNGPGKADLRLTWPTAEQLAGDLRRYYDALGAPPEHLCLVGFPDAIPQAIMASNGVVEELTSDLPFTNSDADPFAEICVARVIGENASFATLFASRVLTYTSLLDPDWQDRACQASWENTAQERFENVGFDASARHTKADLKWLVAPADGQPGKQAMTFEQDSPLAHCAALTHENHSWWHELGETFDWNAEVLLAPAVVESGGCITTALDREADYHSVVARLLRKGAVSFTGNSREGIAQCELQRQDFWNGVLSGQTIGQAHRHSMNSAQVTISDLKENADGAYRYQLQIRTLFGDPAFTMHLPSRPRSVPARCIVANDTLTVHAPEKWWPVKMHVPEDWKNWSGKDLYVLRSAGTYVRRSWCAEQRDREELYMTAEFTTRRHVTKIQQLQPTPAPLGWNGAYYTDEHADGSRTYRWSVRMADFDQTTGKTTQKVDSIDYKISY